MPGGRFVLRDKNDTDNPISPRLYDLGITAGRNVTYLQNAAGNRTAFISILTDGARFIGDYGTNRAVKVYFAGFELPEFDAAGARNWRFHTGTIPAIPVYKRANLANAGDLVTTTAPHGYVNGDPVAFYVRMDPGASLPIPKHTKLYVINVTSTTFQLANVPDGDAIIFDTDNAGESYVYKADAGLFDANQGRPELFPGLDLAFPGLCYIEILLPADLSNGEDEPSKLKIIMDGKLVRDYQILDDELAILPDPVSSKNNALIALDGCVYDGDIPLKRFDPETTLAWRDRCSEQIEWSGGNDIAATPAEMPTQFGATYDNGTYIKTLVGGVGYIVSNQITQKDIAVEFKYTGGDTGAKICTDATGDDVVMGLYVGQGGDVNLLTAANTLIPISQSTGSDVFRFGYLNGEPFIYQNSIPIDAASANDQPNSNFYVRFDAGTNGQVIPEIKFAPSGSAAIPRLVDRFTGGLAILQATPVSELFDTELALSPGVSVQDVDGRAQFLTTSDRTPVMTFNSDAQSVDQPNVARTTIKRRPAKDAPNYYRFAYRDRDDPYLTRKYVYIDRPDHRADNGYISSPLNQYGVMTESQMQRIGETKARLTTDLDTGWTIEAFLDNLKAAKGDHVWLVDDVGGFPAESPARVEILSETLLMNGDVEQRVFEVILVTPDYYSDTGHGKVTPLVHNHAEQRYIPPPPAEALTVSEILRAFQGVTQSAIEGTATFAPTPGQTGRVFFRTFTLPGYDIAPNHGSNNFTGPGGLESLTDLAVSVVSVTPGGFLPAGLNTDAQYKLKSDGGGLFHIVDPDTNLTIDFSTNGSGVVRIYPYLTWKPTSIVLIPNPTTRQDSFTIESVEVGFNQVRVVTESAAGASLPFGVHITAPVGTQGDVVVPDGPTNLRADYDGLMINWAFDKSESPTVDGYQVTDETGRIIKKFIPALTFEETAQASTVARRVYAVSRSGILSTSFAALTFSVPPAVYWVHGTNAVIQPDNSFTKGNTDAYDAGATCSTSLVIFDKPIRLVHYADLVNKKKAFGLSDKKDNLALADLKFGIELNSDGTAKVYENGAAVNTIGAYSIDDRFIIEIAVNGTVTYYRGPVGFEHVLYVSGTTAPRMLYYAAALLYSANSNSGNRYGLEGYLFAADGFFPHYNNFIRCSLNSTTGDVTGAGLSSFGTAGASSFETIDANQDGILEFAFAQNNKEIGAGINFTDTDQNLDSIPLSVYAKSDGTFAVRNLATNLTTGSYAANEVFHVIRINNKILVLKNGAKVYPTGGPFTLEGKIIFDSAFYSDGVVKSTKMSRRVSGDVFRASIRPFSKVGDATTGADELSGRAITSTTADSTYRGGDTAIPVVSGISLGLSFFKSYIDGTGDVEFQLTAAIPNNSYLNFNSVRRVKVRVLNKFNEVVKEFDPMHYTPAGGLLPKLTCAGKYADPEQEAIFAISFENSFGFSRELFLSQGTTREVSPTDYTRRTTPLECTLEMNSDKLNANWQNPADVSGTKLVAWGRLGDNPRFPFGDTVSDTTLTRAVETIGVYAGGWYELRVYDNTTARWSNIALVQTVQKPTTYDPVQSVWGYVDEGSGLAVIAWDPPADLTDVTSYKAFKDGVEFEDSFVDNAAGIGISPGETFTLTVQVVYTGGILSPMSQPVVLTRTYVPPPAQPDSLIYISVSQYNILWQWNLNGNGDPVSFYYSINGGPPTLISLPAGTESFNLTGLSPDNLVTVQVQTDSSDLTAPCSAVTLPVYDGGGGHYCFLDSAAVVGNNGESLNFRYLYDNRESVIGSAIRSFDKHGTPRTDFIKGVTKSTATAFSRVKFVGDDAPFEVRPRHRFFDVNKNFVPIGEMQAGDKVFEYTNGRWQPSEIESIELIDAPDGVEVFNIETQFFNHYLVRIPNHTTDKAVHNRKDDGDLLLY